MPRHRSPSRRGASYQYFPDKEALFAEVRRRQEDAFRQRLIAMTGETSGVSLEAAIARCVHTLIELHREDPGLHAAVSAEGVDDGERRLFRQLAASWLEARREEVRPRRRALTAEIAVDAAESLIHGASLRSPERLSDKAFANEVIDLLTRYLCNCGPPAKFRKAELRRGIPRGIGARSSGFRHLERPDGQGARRLTLLTRERNEMLHSPCCRCCGLFDGTLGFFPSAWSRVARIRRGPRVRRPQARVAPKP